jgi:hypothetical protein
MRSMNDVVETDAEYIRRVAHYDTMREGVNQLCGVLLSRQESATSEQDKARFEDEYWAIHHLGREVDPGDSAAVEAATSRIAARLRELRDMPGEQPTAG